MRNDDSPSYNDSLKDGKKILVLDGDSRTVGWNCTELVPYSEQLFLDTSFTIYNMADGGLTSEDLLEKAEKQIDTLFSNHFQRNFIVVWIGSNDILVKNMSANSVFRNIEEYCNSRREKGWEVLVCTEISAQGGGIPNNEYTRNRLNSKIRKNWRNFADGLIDLGANDKIGALGAYQSSEYFCDSVHLTNQGYEVVADEVAKALKKYVGIN